MSSGPLVLLTNDDGVGADGLAILIAAFAETGIAAAVVAPEENRSGWARRATYRTPVATKLVDRIGEIEVWSCRGTPVDCVRVGLLGPIAPAATLVVSGINHGPNLGDDALLSATVGAAIEGAVLGAGALAISQQDHADQQGLFEVPERGDYEGTATAAVRIAEAMLRDPAPARIVLNVNAPVSSTKAPIRAARLARRLPARGSLPAVPAGDDATGYLTFGTSDAPMGDFETSPGTDFEAMIAGEIAVAPLHLDPEPSSRIRAWTEGIVESATRSGVAGGG